MPELARTRRLLHSTLAMALGLIACQRPEPTTPAPERVAPEPAPVLTDADEALLASLISPDPGDFHDDRARLWRMGALRWWPGAPELPGRPEPESLTHPLELVVVDAESLRVILPLDQLEWRPPAPELVRVSRPNESPSPEQLWKALRITASVEAGDLVAGLRHAIAPTAWLELEAGIPLTPLDREGERLRVGWDDRECGFGLSLVIDATEFGPLHQPGPAAPEPDPSAAPPAKPATSLSLTPATPIFASAEDREPLLRLHAASTIDPEGPGWIAQQITKVGPTKRGRAPIVLRCKGVTVRGWVDNKALVESPGRYALVEETEPPTISSCPSNEDATSLLVGPGTPLFADDRVVGVVVEEIELPVRVHGAWMETCVPSPWGDLELRLRGR